ncbi:hypothetical protein [Flavobacterium sp. LC2016-01]|uniref:hypothetical protein n=1 Tax=Flavobacterium sp. LC2016-01 TaxID=2675876 RepID=UPI0012BB17B8|nr:hypothetical protein [Flavobacterium sp. LC2016-01]MTH17387.1 hypothetical protein [Flavobacterium sp. LC2016-01]
MKLIRTFLLIFIFSWTSFLYSQNKTRAIERKESGVTIVLYLKTEKDNSKTAKYTLKNKEGKVLLKDIRGMENLGRGYQAIDSKNKLVYFSLEKGSVLLKLSVQEVKDASFVCGTVPYYKISIKDTLNHYQIILKTDNSWMNQKDTVSMIGQISKNDADDCYCINREKEYSYSNYPYTNRFVNIKNEDPNAVIFKKNNLYGIFPKTEAIYSEIRIVNLMTKVKKDKLYGYYEINKVPKYKKLADFVGVYARFELPNGKKGYVTGSGYEYMDES